MCSFVFNKKHARKSLSALLATLAILVFYGCATTGLDTAYTSEQDDAGQQSSLVKKKPLGELKVSSIDVLGEGDNILIATNRSAEYTAFTLTSSSRLVIDLPDANLYNVLDTIRVNNRFVKTINVVTYGGKEKIGRIILELQDGVDHEVSNAEDGVLIRLKHDPLAGMPEGSLDEGNDAVVVASSEDVALADNPSQDAAAQPEPLDPATTIKDLQSFIEDADVVIEIVSDGAIGKYNTFELSDPSRVVLDVWGVTNTTGLKALKVDSTDIKTVRVGSHPDKVRFVIDLVAEEIPHYVVTKSGDHLTVAFGPAPAAVESESTPADTSVGNSGNLASDAGEVASMAEDTAMAAEDVAVAGEDVSAVADTALGEGVDAAVEDASVAAEDAVAVTADRAVDEGVDSVVEDASVAAEDAVAVTADRAVDEGVDSVVEDASVAAEDAVAVTADRAATVAEGTVAASGDAATVVAGTVADTAAGAVEEVASVNTEKAPAEAATVVAAADVKKIPDASDSEVSSAIADADAEIADAAKAEKEAAADAEAAMKETDIPQTTAAEPLSPVVEAPHETQMAPPAVVAGNRVKNIDYKKIGDKGFLSIETKANPVYTIKESKNGKTLVLDINDAVIDGALVRTLDATELGTPVSTISAYQGSTDPAVVRVLVDLSAVATHSVMELDGTLNVVFAPQVKAVTAKTAKKTEVEIFGKPHEYTGKKIDLDMMDARVTDILRLLAEVSNLNIIASDDVTGTISLRLRDVPWDQAFDIILQSKGLDKVRIGNVIRVAPASRISQERDAALAAVKASEKLEPLSIKFVPINYAKAEELVEHVKNVLSDRGSVTSEKRTNTLIIKDIKKGLSAAQNLVHQLDTPIPQVLIEARIVEAESSFSRDLGIQWGVDYQTGGNVNANIFGSDATAGQTPPSGTNPAFAVRNGAQNFAVNLPATGSVGTLGALGFILGKAGQNPLVLDLRLSAGEQDGQLRTISRPRVVTMDNKEAKIEDGESVPFETTSASGTSTIFIDANLSLTVTPHITPDGSVLMKIKASKNSIGTFTTSSGEPSIVKKEASTEVLVSDGETTVIGGIISSDSNHTNSGIPYLKDIPLVGKIFQSKSTKESQKELLIFITPTIMKTKRKG